MNVCSEDKSSHPQMLAAWAESDSVLLSIFIGCPLSYDADNMKKVVGDQTKDDIEQLKSCSTVEDA